MIRPITYIIILAAFFSCTKSSEHEKKFYLKANPIQLSEELFEVNHLHLSGNKLIVNNIQFRTNNLIYILSSKNYEIIGRFGVKGEGPKEIGIPHYIGFNHDNPNQLLITDNRKFKVFHVSIDSIIHQQNYFPSNYFDANSYLLSTWGNHLVGNNIYFTSFYSTSSLLKYDIENDTTFSLGQHFKKQEDIPEIAYSQLMRNFIAVKPGESVFASYYNSFNRLEILNNRGEVLHAYQGKMIKEPQIKVSESELDFETRMKNTFYFEDYAVNREYIFLSYLGGRKWYRNIENNKIITEYPSTIKVFNWEAEYIINLELVSPIGDFVILGNKIIAINKGLEYQTPLIYFDLPEF